MRAFGVRSTITVLLNPIRVNSSTRYFDPDIAAA